MNIAIAGAGIGGLTAAIALRQTGHEVTVYERAPAFGAVGAGIVIAANAMAVMRALGLAERIAKRGNTLHFASLATWKGARLSTIDVRRASRALGLTHCGIHRAALHEILAEGCGSERIRCGHEFAEATNESGGVRIRFTNGEVADCDLLIGADGIRSAVRAALFGDEPLRDAHQFCWRGVAPRSALLQAFDDREAIEYWGLGARFGHVPVDADRMYWYATLDSALLDFSVEDFGEVRKRFQGLWSPKVGEILNATDGSSVVAMPLMDRPPAPQWFSGRTVLLGDAIHSTTPNMGQGACMAIESAWSLADSLRRFPKPERAFAAYQAARAPRTRMITERSYRIGAIAQTRSRLLAALRNSAARGIPASVQEKALRTLFEGTPAPLSGQISSPEETPVSS